MIIKTREIPLQAKMEEALLRRLILSHKKRGEITAQLKKDWSGFQGEKQLDYHLSFLSEQEYDIFHGLRLVVNKRTCQLDTLIVSPQVLFIVESKNFSGDLLYDHETKRFIRKYQDREESFPDPIMQVKRQKIILNEWLESNKVNIPIVGLISIGNSTLMLKTNGPREIFQKLLFTEQIPNQVQQIKVTYKEKVLSSHLVKKLQQRLLQSHTPPEINILKKYDIAPDDILTGVQCPTCGNIPMKRIKYHWFCLSCQTASKNAHNQAIQDYLLLYGSITNNQCRQFLHITSINLCSRWLHDLELPSTGFGRYKVYHRHNS